MKVTGAIGVKFKQLQKPDSLSHESVHDSLGRLLNNETESGGLDTKGTVVNLYNDQPVVVPMTNHSGNHAGKVGEEPAHHHIGYRLGRRKFLAERRRKIADQCCIFALLGLVLMIIETECNIAEIYTKVHRYVLSLVQSGVSDVILKQEQGGGVVI